MPIAVSPAFLGAAGAPANSLSELGNGGWAPVPLPCDHWTADGPHRRIGPS